MFLDHPKKNTRENKGKYIFFLQLWLFLGVVPLMEINSNLFSKTKQSQEVFLEGFWRTKGVSE